MANELSKSLFKQHFAGGIESASLEKEKGLFYIKNIAASIKK